jgi:hypothetical protein
MIESGFVGSPAILFGSITRKTYNHDCRHCGDRSESPGNLVAVNFGQTDVEDYKFRAKRTCNLKRGGPISRGRNIIPFESEKRRHHRDRVLVIVDD